MKMIQFTNHFFQMKKKFCYFSSLLAMTVYRLKKNLLLKNQFKINVLFQVFYEHETLMLRIHCIQNSFGYNIVVIVVRLV
jgi:hypothetical protein